MLHSSRQDIFSRGDPNDSTYEEFTNPRLVVISPLGWKQNRPSLAKSVLQCTRVAVEVILLGGILLGLQAVALLYLHLNTYDYCFWKQSEFFDRNKGWGVASRMLTIFGIYSVYLLLLMAIFKWKLIKELNIVTITLLFAFSELTYYLVFMVLEFHSPLGNIAASIWCAHVLVISYIIGKKYSPTDKIKAIKTAFKLCAQFITTVPVAYFLVFFVWPWFARQHGTGKAVLASVFPLILLPAKVVSCHCALHVGSLTHPGSTFVLVVVAYGGSSIAFRLMQAEMESFEIFVFLSIVDGIGHLLERSTVLFRDYVWQKIISRCITIELPRNQSYRTPRSQRLAADMSIQDMLFATVALVNSLATTQLYRIVYQELTPDETKGVLIESFQRVLTGLGIMLIFDVLVILLLTRVMNLPMLRVWKKNWKLHCFVTAVVNLLITFYFTTFAVRFIWKSYENESSNGTRSYNFINCTVPFRLL